MDARLPISVLLLARDEHADLARLLPTLTFAEEVVVVWDPRGSEAVSELAERAGARVLAHTFDGFGPQRAVALAACRADWVLWLDADERLDAAARAALARVPFARHDTAYAFARRTWFLGAPIRFCGWQGESVLRLFPRAAASFDDAPVHEQVRLTVQGRGQLEGRIEHHSYATWEQCVDKPRSYARLGAARAWQAGTRATGFDVALRPPLRFLRQYVLQGGVLDGVRGLLVCALGAWQVLLKYGELWARARSERA